MRRAIRIVGLAVLVAIAGPFVVAHGLAQPKIEPDDPKTPKFTAFPDIKMPRKERDVNGQKVNFPDFDKLLERFTARHPRPIPADAPPLVKVRTAQVNEGTLYLFRVSYQFTALARGELRMEEFEEIIQVVDDVFHVAAELEETAAGKLGYYEDRVAFFKFLEERTVARVNAGHFPPHQLNLVAFYRLQAEADLIQKKESLKGGK